MPYEGEFAGYRSLQRLAQNERVREMLGSFRLRGEDLVPISLASFVGQDLPSSDWEPNLVIAIDGTHIEVPIRNGFPGAEASYLTIASVILDVEKMRLLDQKRPADPREFRSVHEAESIDCAFPGCNVVYDGDDSALDSLRRAIFDVMNGTRAFDDGETLLETYESLMARKPSGSQEQRCPCDDCPNPAFYLPKAGRYQCQCPASFNLYSTDALRIHEGMNPTGPNGALFAEIMQVLERVWVIHVLRALEQRNWLSTMKRLAIVVDGPLAVFGHPAWLSKAINDELIRINKRVRQATGGSDLLLIGVEKGGQFVEHFLALDQNPSGSTDKLPNGYLALLTDAYIKRNIQYSQSMKPYGQDTYFGRKFFYKTRTGSLIVASLPFLMDEHRDIQRAEFSQFPRIGDALRLLDDLFSSRYPNAIAPIVAAHAEAAIPLNIGKKVLEQLARKIMNA